MGLIMGLMAFIAAHSDRGRMVRRCLCVEGHFPEPSVTSVPIAQIRSGNAPTTQHGQVAALFEHVDAVGPESHDRTARAAPVPIRGEQRPTGNVEAAQPIEGAVAGISVVILAVGETDAALGEREAAERPPFERDLEEAADLERDRDARMRKHGQPADRPFANFGMSASVVSYPRRSRW